MELSCNYKVLLKENYDTIRGTKHVIEREIVETKREMEEIEKDYCFLTPDYSDIQWSDKNAENCYENLGMLLKDLKDALKNLKHDMAILN